MSKARGNSNYYLVPNIEIFFPWHYAFQVVILRVNPLLIISWIVIDVLSG